MPRAFPFVRRFLTGVLIAGAVIYALLTGYLYFEQRSMEYFPSRAIETLPPAATGIVEKQIATPDGETLQAWYRPAQAGRPTILFFYGNGGSLTDGKARYTRMIAEGAGFLAINYRGYGESTGTPSEQGLFTDARAAYDWLRTQGVAANDIVIQGHSLGSGVAVYLATQRKARALILEAPFTAASDVAAGLYWFMPVSMLMSDQYLSRERIKDVHIPVLIAHGDRDSIIPFAEGVELFGLANPPKVFVHMRGSDHSTLPLDGVYQCYWKFLGLPYSAAAAQVCAPL